MISPDVWVDGHCPFAPWIRSYAHLPLVESTNTTARQWVQANTPRPLLVWADNQIAGRGRHDKPWWSSAGSLTISLAIDAKKDGAVPELSLAVGLALAETLEDWTVDRLQLKWPNDVFAQGRKLGGVLIETLATPPAIVIGIGVNVSNDLSSAPASIQRSSISLHELCGQFVAPEEVLRPLLERLKLRLLGDGPRQATLGEVRARCMLTGKTIEVRTGFTVASAICLGIDDDGCLQVQSDGIRRRIHSATVRIRPEKDAESRG